MEKYVSWVLDFAIIDSINYKSKNALSSMLHVRIDQKIILHEAAAITTRGLQSDMKDNFKCLVTQAG